MGLFFRCCTIFYFRLYNRAGEKKLGGRTFQTFAAAEISDTSKRGGKRKTASLPFPPPSPLPFYRVSNLKICVRSPNWGREPKIGAKSDTPDDAPANLLLFPSHFLSFFSRNLSGGYESSPLPSRMAGKIWRSLLLPLRAHTPNVVWGHMFAALRLVPNCRGGKVEATL